MIEVEKDLKRVIANNLIFLMDMYQVSRKDLCEETNIKYTTFSDWVAGRTYPRIESLVIMADYFQLEVKDFFSDMRSDEAMKKRILAYARRFNMKKYEETYPRGFFDLFGALQETDFIIPEDSDAEEIKLEL